MVRNMLINRVNGKCQLKSHTSGTLSQAFFINLKNVVESRKCLVYIHGHGYCLWFEKKEWKKLKNAMVFRKGKK